MCKVLITKRPTKTNDYIEFIWEANGKRELREMKLDMFFEIDKDITLEAFEAVQDCKKEVIDAVFYNQKKHTTLQRLTSRKPRKKFADYIWNKNLFHVPALKTIFSSVYGLGIRH